MKNRILAVVIVLTVPLTVASLRRVVAARGPAVNPNVQAMADGHVHLGVLNSSGAPISALAAIGTRTLQSDGRTVKSVRFFDSVLSPFSSKQIMPGESYTFIFFGPNPPPSQIKRDVELKAAIFTDGSTWGDREWVKILQLRRSSALRYNNRALKAIEDSTLAGTTLEDLSQGLTQLQADEMKAASTTAEKQMADFAFSEALLTLGETTTDSGPPAPLGESTGRARSKLLLRINRLQAAKPPVVN
jgi:hypothetical protein